MFHERNMKEAVVGGAGLAVASEQLPLDVGRRSDSVVRSESLPQLVPAQGSVARQKHLRHHAVRKRVSEADTNYFPFLRASAPYLASGAAQNSAQWKQNQNRGANKHDWREQGTVRGGIAAGIGRGAGRRG
jgi:hypothetical protein